MTAEECAAAQVIPLDTAPSALDVTLGILKDPVGGILNTFGGMIFSDITRGPTIQDPVMRERCWNDIGAPGLAARAGRSEGRER